jgi:predicted amidohydrolase
MLLEVCYDLRFPVWSRNRHDYDIILYVANWPTSRIKVWNTLLRARAIENQCYVAGANRIGSDPACNYCGCSAVIDPYGNPIVECGREQEGWIVADIDMVELNAFRKKFPVLEDSDEFEIQTI